MKAFEAFGIVVRTLGLLLVLSGLATLFYALSDLALGGLGIGIIVWMKYGIPAFAVGVSLLVAFGILYPSLARTSAKKRAIRGARRAVRASRAVRGSPDPALGGTEGLPASAPET